MKRKRKTRPGRGHGILGNVAYRKGESFERTMNRAASQRLGEEQAERAAWKALRERPHSPIGLLLELVRTRRLALGKLPNAFIESEVLRHRPEVEAVGVSTDPNSIFRVLLHFVPDGSTHAQGADATKDDAVDRVRVFLEEHFNRRLDKTRITVAYDVGGWANKLSSRSDLSSWLTHPASDELRVVPEKRQQRSSPGAEVAPKQPSVPSLDESSFNSALAEFREESLTEMAQYQAKVEPLVTVYLTAIKGRVIESAAERKEFVADLSAFLNRTLHRVKCSEHGEPSLLGVAGKGEGFFYRHTDAARTTCATGEGDGAVVPRMVAIPWRPPRS